MFGDSGFNMQDIKFLQADRQPCPVCGHPTGDCVGTPAKSPLKVVGYSDPRSKKQQTVLVDKDIYEEVYITEFTKTTVLVAKAGTYITLEKAIELGIKTP